MKSVKVWRTGHASDPGLEREVNEDRVLADEDRGVFLVADGLGGHAAGEMAAETALGVIDKHLVSRDGVDIEQLIRESIAEANNQIYELAQANEKWCGMACVLTVAVVQDEYLICGHVGDTRLYLVWNGTLRKITSDHSPVGEKEDQGLLGEEEAMRHPRRNEVFRDVGSRLRKPDDPDFVQIKSIPFRSDAAFLLCSDGLTDVLPSAEISEIIDRYDGDADQTAHQLVEAVNQAGGRDNVSVVFVAGPEFIGARSGTLAEVRGRHATTRPKPKARLPRSLVMSALSLLVGIMLGMLFWAAIQRLVPAPRRQPAPQQQSKRITVNSADSLGIVKAVLGATSGDVVEIPAGEYLGPVELKDGITLIATPPRQAVLRSAASSSPNAGLGLVARGVGRIRVRGLRIASDAAHPLRIGVSVANSSVELEDLDVSGASEAGIRMSGSSTGTLLGNQIHNNAGPGIAILDTSSPRLVGNRITENGKLVVPLSPGILLALTATPLLESNVITQNGLATLDSLPPAVAAKMGNQNVTDAVTTRPIHRKAVVVNSKPLP